MGTKKTYRIYCETEVKQVEGPTILDTPPTLCPNNPAHTVDAASKTVLEEWCIDNLEATTDPTVDDDINDGYGVGSRWVNTSDDKEFICKDNSSGAAQWVLQVQQALHIPCGSLDKKYSKIVDNTTYTVIRSIVFCGTSRVGTPIGVKFHVGPSNGGTMAIRLRDVTNNNTISSQTGITSEDVYTDTATSNWPENQAILEVQMAVLQEGQTAYVIDVLIGFS